MIGAEPLTGRDTELAVIRRAIGGTRSGVVIAGTAGVGKTWLAREALRRATVAGECTNWIVGTESARALPLGAFIGVLGEALSDPLTNVRRVINSFVAQQRRRRVVIGIDDAHLLDGLSALVVHQLAQSAGVRLVVTLRAGGEEPDAVAALWKDGLLTRLDLESLSASATHTMIEGIVGGPVDARSVARFRKLTGGNALFLRQLVTDQVAAGRMRQLAGVWMWDGDVAVSPSLSDTVGRQMGQLSPRRALVVDTLSQCEPLSVDVLCDLASRDDVEAAESMGLINVERTNGGLMARLAHPLFGELRRAGAGEMYLSAIRGRLASRLADDTDADLQTTVRRALLTLESNLEPDPELFLTSARHAMTLLDLDLADRFATAAARAGASGADGVRAMNLVLLGRGEQAEAALRELTDHPDGHHWATVRAANLVWMLGRPADASSILDGLRALPETAAQTAERLAVEACVDAVSARCQTAAEKARNALASEALPDFHAMMAALAFIMAMGALGDVSDLSAVAAQALKRATTSFQASHMRFWFGAVYGRACRLTGRIDEFVSTAEQLAGSARDVPGLAYANLALLLGNACLVRGHVAEAARLVHEALAGVQIHSITTGLRPASYFALAEAHAKLGQPDQAGDAVTAARSCVPPDFLFMQTALSLADGWAMAAGGRLTDAVAIVLEAARVARDRGQPAHELACIQAAAQWGDSSQAARAHELAEALSLPLAAAVAAHAQALRDRDGEGLLTASAEYRRIGDRAAAADAAAHAAIAFNEGQQRKRGLYAAAIASELANECGGLCTPALRTPAGLKLSGRQRNVVELVAAGLSNREIAEKLVMSVRTVEGHVYRACQRVGAQSREELASIVRSGPGGRPSR
ncbi:LuxR family transcriptional regulator [Mycobacterium intermedium]|uniref:LuxR family transcriptional regulator n=1 Tax=Mycobacterium intermedium TaxID=28445 RepID=A0A1E3SEL4_MYCIE|nr:helix-turn-helix transcriptional regulator [Mycobacterium intermedium]MCV6965500.1 LuxR family transcriptional regulator [Mycobacterium intermedium]ODR00577.1 LuxR family transcriptional regulator [Mycobacterium intermedium]OPE48065.1 LuxR family transcriptional regulator [Mycobacterium intermedium]ORB05725.1 LuxR family transcriptional regulator [Mycobacterium intermedium]